MRRKPFSVVLFDEVEKAHPDVFNTLLQILEDGRLTDSQGRVVDFKNTVLIMTSNLGTRDISKGFNLGFQKDNDATGAYERMKTKVQDELKHHFRPEFLNRIDDIVVFHQLSEAEIIQIVDLMLARVDGQLRNKDMGLGAPPRRCSPTRATTPSSAPGRCAAPSSASWRTSCPRRSSTARCRRPSSSWTSCCSTRSRRPTRTCSTRSCRSSRTVA